MTFKEEIASITARIAKAESDRDAWRACGIEENYMEAYSRVESLALQLERLRQEGLRKFSRENPASRPAQ